MKILAVCSGNAEKLPGKSYKTGINKHPVNGAVLIDAEGVVGDAVCNRKYHGGVDQAVYVEGSVTLDWWSKELGSVVEPGTFGENIVIDGLDNAEVAVGDRFTAGDLVLECAHLRPENERVRREHALERCAQLAVQLGVLSVEVNQRDRVGPSRGHAPVLRSYWRRRRSVDHSPHK